MKFINYLESITGVGVFPLASLIIFFVFFSALSVWAFKADKNYITKMKQMPFANPEQK